MSQPKSFHAAFDHFIHEAFSNEESNLYRIVNDVIVVFIFLSILLVSLESVADLATKYAKLLDMLEKTIVAIFTLEYLANIYSAKRKRDYVFSIWGIIDFLAIAPSYVTLINLTAIKVLRVLRILRFLRLMRMLRLLKLAKSATQQYELSKESKFDTLKMDLQIYFIALFSLVTISSTLIFYAERHVPDTLFTSIPRAMWWSIVTITTVGYGDMYPLTVIGRMIAAATMLCGLALFGLLMNVIGKSMMSSLFGTANLDDEGPAQVAQAEKVRKED